jgi:peptide/nickel transport system permease protein
MLSPTKPVKFLSIRNPYELQLARFRRHPTGVLGLLIICMLVIVALAAPLIAPYAPNEQNLLALRQPPNADYWFGTDHAGRDVFSRVVYGTQIALLIGMILISIEVVIGVLVGLAAGYFGGWIDLSLSVLIDILWAFPPIVLALGIITTLGPGLTNVIIAVALISWSPLARIVRAKVQSLRTLEFVEASLSCGGGSFYILRRHILPNLLPTILVMTSLMLPTALLAASSLSFLGFGAQPPTPEWGAILNEGREYLRSAPWISTFPGLAIVITVMAFNFLGDGLREAFDTKLKQ